MWFILSLIISRGIEIMFSNHILHLTAFIFHTLCMDLDLDRYIANHPFTGIGAMVEGAQFASTFGSWLLPEPI